MVSGLGLGDKTLVILYEMCLGFLDFPLADVAERLATDRSLLGGLRRRPSFGPVVGELFEERCLDRGSLSAASQAGQELVVIRVCQTILTLKVYVVSSAVDALAAAATRRAESATLRIVYEGPLTGNKTAVGGVQERERGKEMMSVGR